MRVGLVTCNVLPEDDEDREPLLDAVRARGAESEWLAWDDPAADWSRWDALVLRSTWNYHHDADAFLAWVDRVGATARLLNPAPAVRWNAHKGYLVELAARGIPVAPTALLRRGTTVSLAALVAERGWSDVVVKPAVSAGSFGTLRARPGALDAAQRLLDAMLPARDMLVQPYLASVEGHGERNCIFIDGELTHSVRKSPRFGGDVEVASDAVPVPDAERALAARIVESLPWPLLYARVDLARDDEGRPLLMELELIEPSLFLVRHPPALARLADAIVRA